MINYWLNRRINPIMSQKYDIDCVKMYSENGKTLIRVKFESGWEIEAKAVIYEDKWATGIKEPMLECTCLTPAFFSDEISLDDRITFYNLAEKIGIFWLLNSGELKRSDYVGVFDYYNAFKDNFGYYLS